MNSSYAFTVIEETHEAWKRLCDPAAGTQTLPYLPLLSPSFYSVSRGTC